MFINKSNNFNIYIIVLLLPISFLIGTFFVNLTAILISLYAIIHIIKYKKLNIFIKKPHVYLFLTLIVFLVSSTFSNYKLTSFENSFSYFSNILLFISLSLFIINDEKKLFLISKVVFIIVMIICIDLWYQKFVGNSFFGYQKQQAGRLTSLFKDEQIPGSVVFKFSPFVIYYLFNFKKNKFIEVFKYFILAFIYFSIAITGERSSFILSTILLIFLLIFNFKLIEKKQLFYYSAFFLIIFIILFNLKNSIIKERFYYTFEQSKNNIYLHLYDNAYQIFKKNIILGSGPQTYRLECPKIKDHCSTHPHNFLLELFSDGGIFSPILFVYSIISLVYFRLKKIKNKFLKSLILSYSVLFFFPLIPTGSFFSSFSMTLTWFSMGFLYSIKKI